MPFINFFLLLIAYLFSGYGILNMVRIQLDKTYTITLSLLLGVAVASFIPFLLQLFYITLTDVSIFISIAVTTLLLSIPTGLRIRKEGISAALKPIIPGTIRIQACEIPFILVIGFLVFISVWRCYDLPPTSRDVLSGPEAIAEVAVREHTMVNSFFSIDLWSTNNQFKSPYLISLQLIYKLAGFPFGQIWLSIVFVSFLLFLYHAMREKLHPIIAGILLLMFIMTPEAYAYTFMILYDYSNMVFFCTSLYFLFGFLRGKPDSWSYLSGILMGIATYIRSETLVLAFLFLPLCLFIQWRNGSLKKSLVRDAAYYVPSLIGYYLPTQLWIKHYLPVHYDMGSLVNTHPSDLGPLFQRYHDIVTRLLASEFAIHLWGYIFFATFFLFIAELVFVRSFTKEARNWLYAIVVLYLGLGFLGFILPLMNLDETTKRSMFKLLPVVVLYLSNNQLLTRLSGWITRWEATPMGKPALAGADAKGGGGSKTGVLSSKSVLTKSGKTVAAPSAGQKSPNPRKGKGK